MTECILLLCCSSLESLNHCSAQEASQCPGFGLRGRDVLAWHKTGHGCGVLAKSQCSQALKVSQVSFGFLVLCFSLTSFVTLILLP